MFFHAAPLLAFLASASAAVVSGRAGYQVLVSTPVPFGNIDDTPAYSFIDKDGKYFFQQSHALYKPTQSRIWNFWSGTNIDDAKWDSALSNYVNPANPLDSNGNTTWRCNNSPTGRKATYSPTGAKSQLGYSQKNYCDLLGTWVDPDTGDWYGLVHNEFTPQPFGDELHMDAIDYAVSKDQGKTWDIQGHAITTPFTTDRGDNATFPGSTYYYGDGDPRLLADPASGYFYVIYGSRIISKTYPGSWTTFYTHAARAPMSGKLTSGWQKWYDGKWSEPGVGGKESGIYPVSSTYPNGYVPANKDYNPKNLGSAKEQIAAGIMPPTTPLFWMDVSYNAYLGLWIGEPNNLDQSGNAPQEFYACSDLATQKWTLIGNSGSYRTASNYRWLIDSKSLTSSALVGKNFRAYCAFGCSKDPATGKARNGEYVNVRIEGPAATPIDTSKVYTISSALYQATAGTETGWKFIANGDGSYTIASKNAAAGVLGVDASSTKGRAWGTPTRLTAANANDVGQQWWVLPDRSADGTTATGKFRIVNRYSSLYLSLSKTRKSDTTPGRAWDDKSGSSVGGGRTTAEQILSIKPVA